MMKKMTFLLALLLSLQLLCPVRASAAGETFHLYYETDKTVCQVGETVTLTVHLDRTDSSSAHNLYTFQDYVLFDHMYLQYVGCDSHAAGIRVPDVSTQLSPWQSRVSVIYYYTSSGTPDARDAKLTVATLRFKALAPVHRITFSHMDSKVQTYGLTDAALTTDNAALTIGDPNAQTYTVSFSGGGSDGGSAPAAISEKAAGDVFRVPENAYTRRGYTFTGWSDGTTVYQPQATYSMPTANVTFTAQWYKEPALHSVSFSGGSAASGAAPGSLSGYAGDKITIPTKATLAREGYSFVGWVYNGKTYQPGETLILPDEPVVFLAAWKDAATGIVEVGGESAGGAFTDVDPGAFCYKAVLWAAKNGITLGTSATTFSPAASCTRGQVVTFLWRAMGSSEPNTAQNPFRDVASGAFCYKAVLWAAEKDITRGTSTTTFGPGATVSRAQFVTFLWRAAGSPAAGGTSRFADVTNTNAYYYHAVLWAAEQGITQGTGAAVFSPNAVCNRGQIVTFLYRWLGE